jgi:hypothetical protein
MVIFTNEYTDRKIKTQTKLNMIFRWLYSKHLKGNTNGMKRIIFFDALCLSVNQRQIYYRRTYQQKRNYQREFYRQTVFVHEHVGNIFTIKL